jgi:hypothetical protein
MTPRPIITEELLTEASRTFIATMQALDSRITEEPCAAVTGRRGAEA